MIAKLAAASIAFVVAGPAFAATSVSGFIEAGVRSTINDDSSSDSDIQTFTAPSTGSTGSISTSATFSNGDASVRSFADVDASWASADAGTIEINWGWDISPGTAGGSFVAQTNVSTSNWSYTFTATADGTFEGSYAVVGTGDTFGLQPIYTGGDFGFRTFGGGIDDPTGSGTFSVALTSGQTYTFSVFNFGNLTTGGAADASANAVINWRITDAAIPEPASWAMMIAGFGIVGGAMRRRTRIAFA